MLLPLLLSLCLDLDQADRCRAVLWNSFHQPTPLSPRIYRYIYIKLIQQGFRRLDADRQELSGRGEEREIKLCVCVWIDNDNGCQSSNRPLPSAVVRESSLSLSCRVSGVERKRHSWRKVFSYVRIWWRSAIVDLFVVTCRSGVCGGEFGHLDVFHWVVEWCFAWWSSLVNVRKTVTHVLNCCCWSASCPFWTPYFEEGCEALSVVPVWSWFCQMVVVVVVLFYCTGCHLMSLLFCCDC